MTDHPGGPRGPSQGRPHVLSSPGHAAAIADPLPRGAIDLHHLAPMPAGEPTWSLSTPCPDCGYRLVRTGEGRPPVVVRCEACGELWEVVTSCHDGVTG